MKVINTYVVLRDNRYIKLYEREDGKWFTDRFYYLSTYNDGQSVVNGLEEFDSEYAKKLIKNQTK
jgi:hypothetical protein